MFVVVVLRTKPRVHIIVPEKYICGLKELEDDLKTWGVNKKHDHLIFWSKDLLNDDSPDETFEPDFNAVSCDVFPPPRQVNAACYIGRIKCFYKSFDAAKQFCDRFRPVLPVAYNSSVLNKQPTPPNNMNNPANGYNEEDSETDEQQSVVNEIGDVSIAQDDLVSENSEEMDLENAEAVEQNTNDEEKYVLAPVNMDQSDTIAFESLFDDNSACDGESVATDNTSQQVHLRIETNENGREINNDSTNEVNIDDPSNQIVETAAIQHQNSNDTTTAEDENVPDEESNTLLRSYKPAENEKVAFTQDGRIEITKTIDEELEMTFILGQQLTAMQDRFHVKMNDKLSGNLPFQENEQEDRAYLVKVKDDYKEVKISGRVVKWLIRVNIEHGAKSDADKSFVKALLISVYSVKVIKSGDDLEEDLMAFIKDLFAMRIGFEDTGRLSSFGQLVTVACDEIRKLTQ